MSKPVRKKKSKVALAKMTTGRGCGRDPHRPRARHRLRPAGRAQRSSVRCLSARRRIFACHPQPARTGRGLYGARRGVGDRQAAGLFGGAGPRPAQLRRGIAHGLWNECSGAGLDRADPRGGDRQASRSSARDPRSGRYYRSAGGSFRSTSKVRATPRSRSPRPFNP